MRAFPGKRTTEMAEEDQVAQVQKAVSSVIAALVQIEKSIREPIEKILRQVQEQVSTLLAELPPKMREASVTLGEHGWSLDSEFSLPDATSFSELFTRGDTAAAEQALVDHYHARLPRIANHLKSWYPLRAKIFAQAFAAHQREIGRAHV